MIHWVSKEPQSLVLLLAAFHASEYSSLERGVCDSLPGEDPDLLAVTLAAGTLRHAPAADESPVALLVVLVRASLCALVLGGTHLGPDALVHTLHLGALEVTWLGSHLTCVRTTAPTAALAVQRATLAESEEHGQDEDEE